MKYIYIICPISALLICQLIKFLVEIIKDNRVNINRLFNGNGGIPSSHTTYISSVTMLIGFKQGFDTPLFALAFIISCIISYDAMGVRWESEKQAIAINKLGKKNKINFNLKEQLGHEPFEVIAGYALGTIIAFLYSFM